MEARFPLLDYGPDYQMSFAFDELPMQQVNDAVLTGQDTLVSCSSDTTIKVCGAVSSVKAVLTAGTDCSTVSIIHAAAWQTWRAFSNGECTRTFRQHTDYVTCLAAARHVSATKQITSP